MFAGINMFWARLVPLRSKYPDSEMLFQKQKMLLQKPKISRDVQNMMLKIIIYRSRPKKNVHRVPVYLMK